MRPNPFTNQATRFRSSNRIKVDDPNVLSLCLSLHTASPNAAPTAPCFGDVFVSKAGRPAFSKKCFHPQKIH
ncbi:hypothetical protein Sinac_0879 [Singulisphaera acidiphila DSM 18658]|uniref:Uncharacterized protein n=1 Tax=Singulisphaera acidiphila (strain ATCC BAA-1392 / DSM 18658 / VKM B-2454 / MOB10) TaxID=886293 RepID=L0D7A5_SINAD|nr:hypothetical protein Sinac_0879 [Singulisphaera acidiphila DSM 18658]